MKNLRKKCGILGLSALLIITSAFSLLSCSTKSSNNGKLKVVCTIFPEYDWTRTIIGDNDKIDLSLVVQNGVDLHSFQPSTEDIVEISTADIFIYIGGVSDNWVTEVLENSRNENMVVINLMDILGNRIHEKEVVEGMEEDHHHHDHANNNDEHIWLSLTNAKLCCEAITEALSNALPESKETFNTNLQNYITKLDELNNDFIEAVNKAPEKTIIVCDRFPFLYLVDDYGLNYYAAFTGCSAETEASFKTIAFLSQKLAQSNLGAVITIDNSDNKIAKTVIENSKVNGCKIYTLDSMQSTTLDEALNGKNYLDTMASNLEMLKKALL